MKKSAIITGADRGLGFAMVREFLEEGYLVYAGQYLPEWKELEELKEGYGENLILVPLDVTSDLSLKNAYDMISSRTDSIDILVNNAGISASAGDIFDLGSTDQGLTVFNANCLGAMRMVRTFLPLIENGQDKRLCFVSSEAGSISVCHRSEGFIYPMSKTALNMAVRLLFEELNPKGYTFRLFHPGWVKSYMSGRKSTAGKFEPEESAASAVRFFINELKQEDVLKMYDNEAAVWPF